MSFNSRQLFFLTRQLFPLIVVSVTNLEKDSVYKVVLEFACNDRRRYKFIKSQWVSSQQSDAAFPDQDPSFVHPESPATGKHWMKQVISFKAAKLTNDKDCRKPTHVSEMIVDWLLHWALCVRHSFTCTVRTCVLVYEPREGLALCATSIYSFSHDGVTRRSR